MNHLQKINNALSRLTGGRQTHAGMTYCGGNVRRALQTTTGDAITPYNRPVYSYNTSTPHLDHARIFTPEEAAALKYVADVEDANWQATQQAYASYEKIHEIGTKRHELFQKVARKDSDRELKRVKANETTERHLNNQTVAYAELYQSHQQNIQGCNAAIAQIINLERNVAANF